MTPPPPTHLSSPAVNESWPWTIDQLTTVVARSFLDPSLHPSLFIYVLTVNVIYVTVCLWFDLRALVYLCNPTIWPSPSIHERDLTAIKRWLFAACVCLAEPTVSCCGTEVMDTNTSDPTARLTSHGRNCLERSAGLFFYHWDFSVTFCWSRTTEDTHGLWLEPHLHDSKYLLESFLVLFFVLV